MDLRRDGPTGEPSGHDGPAAGQYADPAPCEPGNDPPLRVDLEVGTRTLRVRVWPACGADGESGPLLLALHGWADCGESFGPLAQSLQRRWTVVAPDAPAHGGHSWRSGRPYRLAEHAPEVSDLIDRLPGRGATRRIVILGHAMGALTAARVAALCPDDVVHLVLEEPSRTTVRERRSHQRLRAWLLGRQSEDLPERLAYAAKSYPEWSAQDREVWAVGMTHVDPAHLDGPLDWGEPLAPLLTAVHCPVTIVHGRRDRGGIVAAAAARRCANSCPLGGEVVAFPRAGHHPRREDPERFRELLVGVLERYGSPRGRGGPVPLS